MEIDLEAPEWSGLRTLLGAYFNQDFEDIYGSPKDTVLAFCRSASSEKVANAADGARQILDGTDKTARVWAVASLEDVQAGFATVPYPSERVHYVKGPIEQTIPAQMPDQIAILRLDTDWYESTAHEFEHLYPRLVSGGVLMIDDYGFWKGSREATDEFMERTGERLLLVRMDSGRVAVKP